MMDRSARRSVFVNEKLNRVSKQSIYGPRKYEVKAMMEPVIRLKQ